MLKIQMVSFIYVSWVRLKVSCSGSICAKYKTILSADTIKMLCRVSLVSRLEWLGRANGGRSSEVFRPLFGQALL